MRAAPVAIAAAVAVITATGVGVAVAAERDDVRSVDAVSVGAVTLDDAGQEPTTGTTTGTGPTADSPPLRVEGLDKLQGVLTRSGGDDDDDRAEFEIAGVDLDLGPDGWLLSGATLGDYDGNGTPQPVVQELEALLGQEVTVAGRYEVEDSDDGMLDRLVDDSSHDMDVYEIQDRAFRDTAGGPAPWVSAGATSSSDDGDDRTGSSATDSSGLSTEQREQLTRVALDAVGAGSRVESVERDDDSGATWEVDVIDASGTEQHVLVDAAGAVIDVRPED